MNGSYRVIAGFPATESTNPGVVDDNPRVDDVPAQYARIRDRGDYLAAGDGAFFPANRYASTSPKLFVHFQGIQRTRQHSYLAISGGDPDAAAHVFIVHMASRSASRAWGSNLLNGWIDVGDKVVTAIALDADYWHAGGLTLLGDVLAIPIEKQAPARSKVAFLNLGDPENPTRIAHTGASEIARSGEKAGAVALAKISDGRFLCAVWSDSDQFQPRLDLYRSRSTDIYDGFTTSENEVGTWYASEIIAGPGQEPNFSNFQSVNFITQSDGTLYLIGTHNTSSAAPAVPGRDYADLFRVDLDASTWVDGVKPRIHVTKVGKKQILCMHEQANLDAAGGVFVEPRSRRLTLYGAFHWRGYASTLRMLEFREIVPASAAAITDIADGWIDLFENPVYQGRRLSVIGKTADAAIPDYGLIRVQGAAFDERVSSIRYQLPQGAVYRLHEKRSYKGDWFELQGTGGVVEVANLAQVQGSSFGDKVSSSRFA